MKIVILKDASEVAVYSSDIVKKHIKLKPNIVLGLAAGSTPVPLYKELIAANRSGEISFKPVSTFSLDEYLGLDGDHPQSYRYFMNEMLFNHIDIVKSETVVPSSNVDNPVEACAQYEADIKAKGGIDLQILGIGRNGHIGFNEPFSSLKSRTRVISLSRETIDDNSRFFSSEECQPHRSITMGIGTILDSRKIVLMATGVHKAEAIRSAVEGSLCSSCPASALQKHKDSVLILDEASASKLSDQEFYKYSVDDRFLCAGNSSRMGVKIPVYVAGLECGAHKQIPK